MKSIQNRNWHTGLALLVAVILGLLPRIAVSAQQVGAPVGPHAPASAPIADGADSVVPLAASASCAGDVNGDLIVNSFDLAKVLSHFGQAVVDVPAAGLADFNRDGTVNTADLALLLSHFGMTCPMFAAKVDFATGSGPYSVALSDVDGDGKPDIVVANLYGNTVSVLRNTCVSENVNFATNVDYSTWDRCYSVALGYLDGDGMPDIVVANYSPSGTVGVLRNLGNGSFAATVGYAAGFSPTSVALADVDGDGKPDIVVAIWGTNNVSVLRNNGDGTFAPKVNYATGTGPYSVALGDVDGDGSPDIVAANLNGNTVSVLRNVGNGIFSAKVNYPTGPAPVSVALGDRDGDGKLDIVVANSGTSPNYSDGTVSVLSNLGNGTFATKVDYPAGPYSHAVALGDVDGDGKLDIVVANSGTSPSYSDGTVSVLSNLGNGTFAAKVDYATGRYPRSVALSDVDGDGKLDIIVANLNDNTVSVLRNQSGGFRSPKPAKR